MEQLGENQFFYSEKTDRYYKVVNIKNGSLLINNFVIQECKLELFTITQVAIDPDNSKEYKHVAVYEKKPFGRKKQMHYKLFKQLIDGADFF